MSQPATALKGPDEWVEFTLKNKEPVADNANIFTFAFPDPHVVSGVQICSCIQVLAEPPGGEQARPYTPITNEDIKGYLQLCIKHYPKGAASSYVTSLNIGDKLKFKGPFPKYKWEANKHKEVYLIAGGSAITPMQQIIRQVFKDPADHTNIKLIYANVEEKDIWFKKDFEELAKQYPQQFQPFFFLNKPPDGWQGETGYITPEFLKAHLKPPSAGQDMHIFVCGPPPMMDSISGQKVSPKDQGKLTGLLADLGYSADHVYKF